MRKKVNLLGKIFGHVIVIGEQPNDGEWVQWLCKCVCGKEIVKRAQDLKRGRSLSCGCSHGNRKYSRVKSSAADIFRTNYGDSDFSVDEFVELSQNNCHYCDAPPSNKYQGQCGDVFIYNGLDRIDSALPHLKSNCVPCCKVCNIMKREFSIEYFINHIKRILSNIGERY